MSATTRRAQRSEENCSERREYNLFMLHELHWHEQSYPYTDISQETASHIYALTGTSVYACICAGRLSLCMSVRTHTATVCLAHPANSALNNVPSCVDTRMDSVSNRRSHRHTRRHEGA